MSLLPGFPENGTTIFYNYFSLQDFKNARHLIILTKKEPIVVKEIPTRACELYEVKQVRMTKIVHLDEGDPGLCLNRRSKSLKSQQSAANN